MIFLFYRWRSILIRYASQSNHEGEKINKATSNIVTKFSFVRRDRLYVTLAEPKKFPHFLVLFYCLDHKELHFFPVEEGHRLVVHEYHAPLKSGEP